MNAHKTRFIQLLFGVSLMFTLLNRSVIVAAQQSQHKHHYVVNSPASQSAVLSGDASPDNFTKVKSSEEPLHIVVGHSTFINTKHPLTRVYVTNPAIIYAYTSSANQVLITSKKPGLSSLVVWDDIGESQSYLFSSDIDIDTLRQSIKQAMPDEDIHVYVDEGRVMLSGMVSTSNDSEVAAKLASLYSTDVSNALIVNSSEIKQVRLKVRIVEVDRSKLDAFGFNFFSAGGNNLAQTTTGQFTSSLTATTSGSSSSSGGTSSSVGNKTVSITNPLNFLLYSSKLNVGAMLQDMESKQVLQILAEPTISTLSGQQANFLSGGEFPFPVVQGIAGGLTSISIQFRPYGVKLAFTPVVNVDGTIDLKVAPEVSALDYTNAVTISGYTIPALSTRRAETQVVLKSGQSFAISGLLDRRTTDSLGNTPGIASVPILGALFKSKSINHSTTELIVIVTPSIVDPMSENAVIEEPKTAIPTLDPQHFDATLPKAKDTK